MSRSPQLLQLSGRLPIAFRRRFAQPLDPNRAIRTNAVDQSRAQFNCAAVSPWRAPLQKEHQMSRAGAAAWED